MNDFADVEAELKRLKPAAPSPELMAHIERALREPVTPAAGVLPRRKTKAAWFAFGAGLAAAAALLLVLARVNTRHAAEPKAARLASGTPAAQVARGFVPDGVTRVVYDQRDEGLVFASNATEPARRFRSRSRETLQWKDPSNGASLRVSYPTEEIELIPVSLSVQ